MSKALTRSDKTKVYEYERSNLYEYEEASEKIRPLALVLFAGKEFVSDIICFGQSLKGSYRRNQERVQRVFSHVGVIVDKNIMPGIRNTLPGRHYVLESTASGKLVSEVVDCESMKGVLGVQIRDFEWVCATYNGVIAVANLQDNPFDPIEGESVEENQQRIGMLRECLSKFHSEHYHQMYQINILRLISALFPAFRGLKVCFPMSKKWVFCSELVAMLYSAVGIIKKCVQPDNVVPMNFLIKDEVLDAEVPDDLFKQVFYIRTLQLHKELSKRKRLRIGKEQDFFKKNGRIPTPQERSPKKFPLLGAPPKNKKSPPLKKRKGSIRDSSSSCSEEEGEEERRDLIADKPFEIDRSHKHKTKSKW